MIKTKFKSIKYQYQIHFMKKIFFLNVLFLFFFSCEKVNQSNYDFIHIEWIDKPSIATVGDKLKFSFKTETPSTFIIKFSTSFGSTLINVISNNNINEFYIPEHITKRAGVINYYVLNNNSVLVNGHINMQPKNKLNILETYFGPQHIIASENDFSMLVTIPTDIYDNPNKASFSTTELYKDSEKTIISTLSEIIHFQKFFSKTKTGKVFLQSKSNDVLSKEFEATILASNPIDFKINYSRNHSYADGKELTTLMTSVIKDKYGNIIENGTLVSFILRDNDKTLKIYGKTIEGVAKAESLHPKIAQNYEVRAYINGFAKSNSIYIEYKLKK